MNKMKYLYCLLLVVVCFSFRSYAQPCFPDKVVTAAYATGGESPYIDKVLWLTWGATDQGTHPYGEAEKNLNEGAMSYASIHLGGNSYLCVEVEVISVDGGAVNSYSPGEYFGDSLDKLYNIGGDGKSNQLVSGIINKDDKGNSILSFRAKATISGDPIRISGLAIADAESLAANEYIKATAYGSWSIVDVRKNTAASEYKISKKNAGANQQRLEFNGGNNANTGAVAFLDFNEFAYDVSNDFAVEFKAELKGEGNTALAIGLLTPNADLGDAPESYGAPIHLLHNLKITDDGIQVASSTDYTNINTDVYVPGALMPYEGRYLGTSAPDGDNSPMHSVNADGDDLTGDAGPMEEDAWPEKYRRFSYKTHYVPGNIIEAEIAYHNGEFGDNISGWIDFDLSGTFDADEIQSSTITHEGSGTVTLRWVVPPTRRVYSTYVRLRYFDHNEDASLPDSAVNFGEVEDHRIYILGPSITNPMLQNTGIK